MFLLAALPLHLREEVEIFGVDGGRPRFLITAASLSDDLHGVRDREQAIESEQARADSQSEALATGFSSVLRGHGPAS